MRLAISKRDLRTLLRGGVIMATIVLVGRGGPAWRAWDRGTRAEAARTLHELAVAELGIAQLRATRDSAAARRARLDSLGDRLFVAASTEEASAELALLVTEQAAADDVTVASVQVRPDSSFAADGFRRLAVRLNGSGDVFALAGFVASIEKNDALLAVRELSVTQPEPGAPENKPESLRFELVVEGLAMHARLRGGVKTQ